MAFGGNGEFQQSTQPSSGGGGSGTVTSVSVVSTHGFSGTVANPTTTPAITLNATPNGLLKSNGTTMSAATAGTDYSAGTSALATGVLKSTTGTGALTIAVSGTDYSAGTSALATGILKSTTGTGALSIAAAGTDYISGPLTDDVTTSGNSATLVGTANVESIIRANTLNQMAAPSAALSMNSQRITNLATPTTATDANTAKNALLAATYYEPNGSVSKTIATQTLTAIDTTNLTITATAISTVIVYELEAFLGFFAGSTGATITSALFTHGTSSQVGYTTSMIQLASTAINGRIRATIRVTGLTIGNSYQVDWAWSVTSASDTAIMLINAQTGTSNPYGPAIMRAYAG